MRILVSLMMMFLFIPSISNSDSAIMEDRTLLQWENVTISIPDGFEYKKDERKMFVAKKVNDTNNFIVISTVDPIDVDSFIDGLRNDGIKMILLAVGEESVGGLDCRVVRYRIAEDDIKKIMISYFIVSKNVRIIYYGLVDEFSAFARIISSLKFAE